MANKTSDDIQTKDLDNWKLGQVSYFSKSRMQETALKTAYNVIYDYDAVVRPRGSFNTSQIPDLPEGHVPLGCDFPFKRPDKTEGLINVFSDGSKAWIFVLKPDLTGWQKFDSVEFNKDLPISFAQIAGAVVIGNGDSNFTYYITKTNEVKQLVKVQDPTATPTATPTGFSGTNAIDYYYRVYFNGIGGTTKMTPAVKISSSTIRDTWGDARSVAISIANFTLDPNAQSWGVVVAGVSTGTGAPTDTEYNQIGENLPLTQKNFTDTGAVTVLKSAPVENTTEGIKAWYFVNISGRLWAIGDGIVYWGGDVGNELYFGSANGSDSYKINPDSAETPMAITLGRDNAGTTCINLITRTMAGQGAIWDVYATTNSITANGQTFSTGTYQFKKREGDDGTDAPYSVIRANNNAYYLSLVGFKSTGVKPNVSGIQSTDIVSSAIRDRVLNLAQSDLSNTYAAYFDETLYWTVAYGSEKNNEIWCYDILHGGIWSIWRVPADCIFRWASTKNESPSLYIRQGNKLLRYYKNSHTHADASGVFESYIESGQVPFGENQLEWVHILKNIWQFDQAVGQIELTVNIHAKNGEIIKVNKVPFNESTSSTAPTSGWDAIRVSAGSTRARGSWDNHKWDEVLADLLNFKDPSDKKVDQKIRKNAAYISYSVRANTRDTYYELSRLSMLFTYIGLGVEFLSQKGVIKI